MKGNSIQEFIVTLNGEVQGEGYMDFVNGHVDLSIQGSSNIHYPTFSDFTSALEKSNFAVQFIAPKPTPEPDTAPSSAKSDLEIKAGVLLDALLEGKFIMMPVTAQNGKTAYALRLADS